MYFSGNKVKEKQIYSIWTTEKVLQFIIAFCFSDHSISEKFSLSSWSWKKKILPSKFHSEQLKLKQKK